MLARVQVHEAVETPVDRASIRLSGRIDQIRDLIRHCHGDMMVMASEYPFPTFKEQHMLEAAAAADALAASMRSMVKNAEKLRKELAS